MPGTLRAKLSCEKPIRLDLRPEYVRVHLSFQPGEAVGDARVTGDQMSSRQVTVFMGFHFRKRKVDLKTYLDGNQYQSTVNHN